MLRYPFLGPPTTDPDPIPGKAGYSRAMYAHSLSAGAQQNATVYDRVKSRFMLQYVARLIYCQYPAACPARMVLLTEWKRGRRAMSSRARPR